ncbi:MAG: hypothetical protein IPM99_20590 [Rubrivivax sp.]|nr:hypothetical protein [Rubrivivax sp.]
MIAPLPPASPPASPPCRPRRRDALPDSARAIARRSLLDWAAVGRAGIDEPVARIA